MSNQTNQKPISSTSSSSCRLVTFPVTERNKDPILNQLKRLQITSKLFGLDGLKPSAPIRWLEVGSGTGQHVAHFAQALVNVQFQPTDCNDSLFVNIVLVTEQAQLTNVLPPLILDLTWPPTQWPVEQSSQDVLYCSNVLHITPSHCTVGLFEGAGRVLKPRSGLLIVYGPFAVDGHQNESLSKIDTSLKTRNSDWGIRDTRLLHHLALVNGLTLVHCVTEHHQSDLPANNQILIFQRL